MVRRKFPRLTTPFLRRLLYSVLINSRNHRPTPLAKNYLGRFKVKDPNNPKDRGHKWICEALSEALGVRYRNYSNQYHIARSIQIDPKYAAEILDQWHSYRLDPADPDAINSATGELTSDKEYARIIRTSKTVLRTSIVERYPDYPLPELLRDINETKLPSSLFRRFEIVGDELAAKRDAAADEVERADLDRRYHYLRQAERSARTGYLYEPASPAYRLYVRAESLQAIHRDDRRALTRQVDGYYELDLRNAHFAILATLAKSDEMNALLDGGSIWDQLLDWCCLDRSMRDAVKRCVTAGLYGAGRARRLVLLEPNDESREEDLYYLETCAAKDDSLRALGRQRQRYRRVELSLDPTTVGRTLDRLESHPAMVAMSNTRKSLEKQIKNDGGLLDAFGRFITPPKSRSAATVLHAVATSYERLLIDVIYQRARKNQFGDFRVILDQHDGVTIYFSRRDEKRTATILDRLKEAVHEKAQELGINTSLEIKNGTEEES